MPKIGGTPRLAITPEPVGGLPVCTPDAPSAILAIDPGGEHVGWAVFARFGLGWRCVEAVEVTPEQAFDRYVIGTFEREWDVCIVETWRLFPEMALTLIGSDMPTSQLIGAFTHVHRHALRKAADERSVGPALVWQDPTIKETTFNLLKKRGVPSRAVRDKHGGHAKDAECHGWHFIMKTLKGRIHPDA
jgi:hypothetical protein